MSNLGRYLNVLLITIINGLRCISAVEKFTIFVVCIVLVVQPDFMIHFVYIAFEIPIRSDTVSDIVRVPFLVVTDKAMKKFVRI